MRRRRAIPLARPEGVPRRDRLSPAERSALMSRVKSRDTGPEKAVAAMLDRLALAYRTHAKDLPGRPDFVLDAARVVVVVDGDFWHGFRFGAWKLKLSDGWRAKIARNVRRDALNRRLLRGLGWTVVRLWQHSIDKSPTRCRRRILDGVRRNVADDSSKG
jgi:DNA mismatch endonuclease (patch repair protein)